MKTYFADLLREARERSGLTQKELAQLIKVDNTYISKIERGVLPPPAREKVLKIADVLGIINRVERYHLLLAADSASIEDLEGLNETGDGQQRPLVPPRHATFVLTHPPMPKVKNTLGERIERLVLMADLSNEEKEAVEKHLEAVTRQILTLIEDTRQLKLKNEDKS
jgi:transcriptional regulator with XRE-family HTH domain